MSEVIITFNDSLTDFLENKMRDGFVEHEAFHGIVCNYKPFSLVLTNAQGEEIGVLNAYTAFSEVYIDDFWIEKSHRGKGYGKKLVQALEDHFEGKGYNNINLVTSAFQAPEFYKKCGFEVEFVRENKVNPKLTKTFFVKYFKNNKQTQGILEK